jgi:hypothetical protein
VSGHLLTYSFDFLIAFAGAAAVFAYWVANRKRIAAESIWIIRETRAVDYDK